MLSKLLQLVRRESMKVRVNDWIILWNDKTVEMCYLKIARQMMCSILKISVNLIFMLYNESFNRKFIIDLKNTFRHLCHPTLNFRILLKSWQYLSNLIPKNFHLELLLPSFYSILVLLYISVLLFCCSPCLLLAKHVRLWFMQKHFHL